MKRGSQEFATGACGLVCAVSLASGQARALGRKAQVQLCAMPGLLPSSRQPRGRAPLALGCDAPGSLLAALARFRLEPTRHQGRRRSWQAGALDRVPSSEPLSRC